MKTLLMLLAASFLLATAALAEERATPQDAEDLVKTAVSYLKRHGAEKAYKQFMNKEGAFIYKDLYIMVYDMSGKCLAHGADASRVGKDYLDQKDANGKQFVRERIQIAKEKGKGWQEYVYKNPSNGKVEPKVVYLEKFEETIVTSGAYKP